jgi:serine/threonine protein kinase
MSRVPDVTELRPGDPEEIAGYRVVSRLGAGGQGVVYLATAPSGTRVAIKQLRFGPQDERARQQFTKEVAAARLVAPFCTAQVLDADLDSSSPYVVSEYIEGLSLQQRVERGGPITGAALQRLAIGSATALAAIHQAGVVHRDFKPANVMLAYDGPRVIDFGIARNLSTETTMSSKVFGTPAYMAPEQLRGERVGPATDMFAWASVIAFAATGQAPFDAPNMAAVMHRISSAEPDLTGVPAELLPVLRHCLDKDPAGRPTAQQALALLLGRPAPARDASDATQVLTEATDIVHAAAATSTTRKAPPTPPTLLGPAGGGVDSAARGRRLWVPAALVLGLLALVGLYRVLPDGLFGDDHPGPNGAASSSAPDGKPASRSPQGRPTSSAPEGAETQAPPTTQAPTSEPTTVEASDGTIPAAFDGTWEGRGFQPQGTLTSWTVKVKLDEGETTGEMKLEELDCSGTLTLTAASDKALDLDAVMDDNPDGACAERASVRLTRLSEEQLRFQWQDAENPENQAGGVLSRH